MRVGQRRGAGGKGQTARRVGAPQAVEVAGPEDDRQGPYRKEEATRRPNPLRCVAAQRAAGHHAMEMEVLRERLAPRVQDGGHADRAAQMPRVAPEGQ